MGGSKSNSESKLGYSVFLVVALILGLATQ